MAGLTFPIFSVDHEQGKKWVRKFFFLIFLYFPLLDIAQVAQ